jgi:hypothetical protein
MIFASAILFFPNRAPLCSPFSGCRIHSKGNLRTKSDGVQFIRLKEDFPVGNEVLTLYAYPRNTIYIAHGDNSSDDEYFRLRENNSTTVSVILDKSLDNLVDNENPQSVLKFSIYCSGTSAIKHDNVSIWSTYSSRQN